ncbi:hypothetical protein CN918_29415 [Priestia megaterium]|nr:hypothetical protein CN918_29415 [Priestia megaterium]
MRYENSLGKTVRVIADKEDTYYQQIDTKEEYIVSVNFSPSVGTVGIYPLRKYGPKKEEILEKNLYLNQVYVSSLVSLEEINNVDKMHQYALHMDKLITEVLKFESEVKGLTLEEVRDLLSCVPNHNLSIKYESVETYTVSNKRLKYIHQYARYLNTLVDDIIKYGGVYDLTLSQANELVGCLPHTKLEIEREGNATYNVETCL